MQPFSEAKMNDYFAALPQQTQQKILRFSAPPQTLGQLQALTAKLTDAHNKKGNY